MERRTLSAKEVETAEILIRILERTIPSLDQSERIIVKRCILRMKNDIAETDRRRKNDRRKENKMRQFYSHCFHTEKPSR